MTTTTKRDKNGVAYERLYLTKTYVRPGGFIYRETTLDGLLNAGPMDEPSQVTFDPDGNPIRMAWHRAGVSHRSNGPAVLAFHDGTNQPMTELFEMDGKPRPADEGPYIVRLDLHGRPHRLEFSDGTVQDLPLGHLAIEP